MIICRIIKIKYLKWINEEYNLLNDIDKAKVDNF
jgi:hypothetical protein